MVDENTGINAVNRHLDEEDPKNWIKTEPEAKLDIDWLKTIVGCLAFCFCIIVLTLGCAACVTLWRWIV